MKISYRWLQEFVDIPDEPRVLGDKVTLVGLAVDTMEASDNDAIFELDITTNRPDCLSHMGVGREVSAIYGSQLRGPAFELNESSPPASDVFSVSIADPDLCRRYCGRYIAGVKVGPSPDWLKARLESMGVRSINNVADVTNYVMMELGHPLHAFDANTLQGRQIIVRRADFDEPLTTLDGVERRLNPSILVIADSQRAVALAGIMGGADTEISATTVDVFLESAHFTPLSIRKAARSLNMNTEASYRFERGADIEMARFACDRAAAMIQNVAGGEIYSGAIDVYPGEGKAVQARLRRDRIQAFLGAAVPDEIVERIFSRLEFKAQRTGDGWTVQVPSFRVDVSTEEDLLEEIARHHGFDKFGSTLPEWRGSGSSLPNEEEERLLRSVISGSGYTEIYTYSFSDENTERLYRPSIEPVKLSNPMTEDATILRTSLIASMLNSIQWNLNRGLRDVQLYELNKVYASAHEQRSLILASTGGGRDFYDIKGDAETILDVFGQKGSVSVDGLPAYYHPGRSARLGEVAIVGELHPDSAEALKIRQRIYLAEIDFEGLLRARQRRQVRPIPRFPSVRRDFSLLVNRGTRYGDIEETIRSAAVAEIVRVEPFDRLESGSFPENKYSLAVSVTYQSPERTLTDTEVEQFDSRILELLAKRLYVELRK